MRRWDSAWAFSFCQKDRQDSDTPDSFPQKPPWPNSTIILAIHFFPCHQFGNDQFKYSGFIIHDAAGQPQHRHIPQIGKHEHGTGKNRWTIGFNPGARGTDSRRSLIIGINWHTACDHNHVGPFIHQFPYGIRGHLNVIRSQDLPCNWTVQVRKFLPENRTKTICYASTVNFHCRWWPYRYDGQ